MKTAEEKEAHCIEAMNHATDMHQPLIIDITRPVTVYEWEDSVESPVYHKTEKCKGRFHQFGVDYQEIEYSCGNFTTAIVELDDGTVLNVSVDLIKFNDRNGE